MKFSTWDVTMTQFYISFCKHTTVDPSHQTSLPITMQTRLPADLFLPKRGEMM